MLTDAIKRKALILINTGVLFDTEAEAIHLGKGVADGKCARRDGDVRVARTRRFGLPVDLLGVVVCLGGEVQKSAEIPRPSEVDDASSRSVPVPGHVGLHGVRPHRAEATEPIGPMPRVHPRVVDGARDDQMARAVALEMTA